MAVVGQWDHSTSKWVDSHDMMLQRKTSLFAP